jgi:hypothetical protein
MTTDRLLTPHGVPADRQHDHLGREAEASEGGLRGGSRARAAGSHDSSLPTQDSLAADATVPFQARLNGIAQGQHGFHGDTPLAVDGDFGPKTEGRQDLPPHRNIESDGQVGPQTSAKPSPRICRGSCSEFFRSGDRSTSVLLRDAGTPEVLTEGWDWSLLDGVAAEFRRGGP